MLPLNATWLDVARVQLRPWRSTGVSVGRLLALTSGMRRPYGTQPAGAAAVIDTAGWRVDVGPGEAHEVKQHTLEQLEKQLAESRALLPSIAL